MNCVPLSVTNSRVDRIDPTDAAAHAFSATAAACLYRLQIVTTAPVGNRPCFVIQNRVRILGRLSCEPRAITSTGAQPQPHIFNHAETSSSIPSSTFLLSFLSCKLRYHPFFLCEQPSLHNLVSCTKNKASTRRVIVPHCGSLRNPPLRTKHTVQPLGLCLLCLDSGMGRVFRRFLDSARVYTCSGCDAHLADEEHVISKSFQGRLGRAFLF